MRSGIARKATCCFLGAAALVAFGGCGGARKAVETTPSAKTASSSLEAKREAWISTDGYKGAQNVGILMAEKLGYFDDLGLQIGVTSAEVPDWPIKYLREEQVDLAVLRQPQVVLAEEKGAPLIAVGALIAQPTAALIWLKRSGIEGIADLKGKTIAIPGASFQEDFLQSLLERNGLRPGEVNIISIGYRLIPALAHGRVDAVFGGSWNVEGAALAALGLKPVVLRARSLGFPSYDEQVLVARTGWVSDHGKLVRDILAAVARGTAAAVDHPKAAARLIEEVGETDPSATPKLVEAEVEKTLPLLSRGGHMSLGQGNDLAGWMHEEGWTERALPGPDLLTNAYLPLKP